NSNAVEYQNSSITQIDEVVSLQVPTSEYVPNSNAKDRSEDYWKVAFDSKEEAEEFFLKFQSAVANNDKKTVASMCSFPIYGYLGKSSKIKQINKNNFSKKYEQIFHPKYKEEILRIKTRDLWATWVGVTVDGGQVWMRSFAKSRTQILAKPLLLRLVITVKIFIRSHELKHI
ncbi:MAG: hypothetical protein ABIP78_06530, partial [Pyrinomonadaceae bacterium]